MKHLLFIGFLLTSYLHTHSQKNYQYPDSNGVYTIVDEAPEFPGGDAALMQYLMKNLNYSASDAGKIMGSKELVSFVIDEKGKVRDIKVLKSITPEIDAEFIRVLLALPNFKPGKKNGKPVKVRYTLPMTIDFK